MTCDACNQSTSGRCWAHTATITLPATPDPHTEPRTEAIMDYPTAWEFVRGTDPEDHAERCSWRSTSGAFLCDCSVIWREYGRREARAEASTGADAPPTCDGTVYIEGEDSPQRCGQPLRCPWHHAPADVSLDVLAEAYHVYRCQYPGGTIFCGSESGPFEFDSAACNCRMDMEGVLDAAARLRAEQEGDDR